MAYLKASALRSILPSYSLLYILYYFVVIWSIASNWENKL